MGFLARFSPIAAINDLRRFLATRQRHELVFFVAAIVVTTAIIAAFVKDSHIETPYQPNIIYVENWRADRSDAQIKAQQKIDQVEKDKRLAELDKRRKARQAEFKRLDDKLTAMGL